MPEGWKCIQDNFAFIYWNAIRRKTAETESENLKYLKILKL